MMAGAGTYHIEDEPRPGGLEHLAVGPVWPFFALMFAGSWMAFPWFVLNGFAVGSPTRYRELALAVGGFAGNFLLAVGLVVLHGRGVLSEAAVPYAEVLLIVWKLAVGYVLHHLQSRTFFLYEHFGGQARNGLPIVFLGALLGRRAILGAVKGSALYWVLA
jgi:hypothetical protein